MKTKMVHKVSKRPYCDLCGMTSRHWAGCPLDPKAMSEEDLEVVAHTTDGAPVMLGAVKFWATSGSRAQGRRIR